MENMNKWNYDVPTSMMTNLWDIQTDWNQTIVTKFNQLSVDTDGKNNIKVPIKFKKLINSLAYYSREKNNINDRYNIEFIDSDENIMYVGEHKLEILNY